MARRRIDQEALLSSESRRSSLNEISDLFDWSQVEAQLSVWPSLAWFRAMLLAVWQDQSDIRLAEALEEPASFRRICGFAGAETAPERTAFVRFRRELL